MNVSDYRGYAHLGIGAYLLNHTAEGEAPELVISVATDEEKAGRVVGDDRDNVPGAEISTDSIVVRLRFENAAGLDALEKQLRYLRSVHFPADSALIALAADFERNPAWTRADAAHALRILAGAPEAQP